MIEFFVDGKPIGKERPRKGTHGFYTPKKTKEYEQHIAYKAKEACMRAKITAPLETNVAVEILLYTQSKADIDNIAKSILDGMNNIVYNDDQQVSQLTIKRISHPDLLEKALVKITYV